MVESVEDSQAFLDSEIGGRHHVEAAKSKNEKHLRRPFADAMNGCEVVDDFLIIESADAPERKLAGFNRVGK